MKLYRDIVIVSYINKRADVLWTSRLSKTFQRCSLRLVWLGADYQAWRGYWCRIIQCESLTFICFRSSMFTWFTTAEWSGKTQQRLLLMNTVQNLHKKSWILTAFVLCDVVLCSVHVWTGLRSHVTLDFLIRLEAFVGHVCYIALHQKPHQTRMNTNTHAPNTDMWKYKRTVSMPRARIWSARFSAIVRNFFGSERASTIAEEHKTHK